MADLNPATPAALRESRVLDLGCGYGQFINHIQCGSKFGMDLNPSSASYLNPGVRLLQQDCLQEWDLDFQSLDVVFTGNFFEPLRFPPVWKLLGQFPIVPSKPSAP